MGGGENRKMTYVEEFEIIFVDILLSRGWNITPYSLTVGCIWWFPSKEHSMERGENSNCPGEKSDPHYLSQAIKVNMNGKSCW